MHREGLQLETSSYQEVWGINLPWWPRACALWLFTGSGFSSLLNPILQIKPMLCPIVLRQGPS